MLAPLVWFNDSALEHRSVGFQVLSDGLETELVEAAERGQAGRIKSRVGHVEVFRMGSVGTSIFRETSTPTRTATRSTDYTLVREEPHYGILAMVGAGIGVTVLPRLALGDLPGELTARPLIDPKPIRRVVLLVRREIAHLDHVETIRDALRNRADVQRGYPEDRRAVPEVCLAIEE
ncbi:LysR substrate-binding domain-containing protein [Brevibacterium jeotgali]|uniref:LysR substrate-binding domain-containing protein n=1 Tax=Brevibacterium jeotgali TaxID=1262550 RepID=UPI001FE8CE6E|nr:LysR substrate-binding domain-containing protein [Brevibacterium jeotgali]